MLLSEGLRHSRLVELGISHCGLNDIGGAFIGHSLLSCTTLTSLDLGSNNVSGGACSVIAEVIKENSSLKRLNLRDNPLGLVGTRKLLQARRTYSLYSPGSSSCKADVSGLPALGNGH